MLHGRLLRYLDEVARSGSIRKAADRLNVAASAINRQICLWKRNSTPRCLSACPGACASRRRARC